MCKTDSVIHAGIFAPAMVLSRFLKPSHVYTKTCTLYMKLKKLQVIGALWGFEAGGLRFRIWI